MRGRVLTVRVREPSLCCARRSPSIAPVLGRAPCRGCAGVGRGASLSMLLDQHANERALVTRFADVAATRAALLEELNGLRVLAAFADATGVRLRTARAGGLRHVWDPIKEAAHEICGRLGTKAVRRGFAR
jgi:hypothetical protein